MASATNRRKPAAVPPSHARVVAEHAGELAELECQEMGNPVGIGRGFVDAGVAALDGSAAGALSYRFEDTVEHPDGSRTRIIRHPLAVVAVITPWNFPVTMVLGALGPLLATENTVVVKPSERAPLSIVQLFELSPLPPGVLNLVLGDGRAGGPLAAHEEIGLVHFTGSIGTGRAVGAEAARRLHRSVLELGGKDPGRVARRSGQLGTTRRVRIARTVASGTTSTADWPLRNPRSPCRSAAPWDRHPAPKSPWSVGRPQAFIESARSATKQGLVFHRNRITSGAGTFGFASEPAAEPAKEGPPV